MQWVSNTGLRGRELDAFKHSLSIYNDIYNLKLQKLSYLIQDNRTQEAREAYPKLHPREEDHIIGKIDFLIRKAYFFYNAGDYQEATDNYNILIDKYINDMEALDIKNYRECLSYRI